MPFAVPCDFKVEQNARVDSRTITEIALAATAAKYTMLHKNVTGKISWHIAVTE